VGPIDATQQALEQALSGASLRQQVLANNIANANTPGFQRSDVDFHGQLAAALQSGSSQAMDNMSFSPQVDSSGPIQANGNNVDVDTEMSDLSQNALDYQSLVEVAAARLKMMQIAIGSGG
jgi:flagellar basal-body rod protein FlgB